MRSTPRCRRRATAYFVVLVSASMVTMVGLSALVAHRVQLRISEQESGLAEARFYARSAIEMGLLWIEDDPDWRDNRSSGVWVADVPIGEGSFSLEGIDPSDKDLADSASDLLVLIGTGAKGTARYKLQVTLVPQGQSLTCLETALHAGNDLLLDGTVVECDQTISANNNVVATNANVNADVEAANTVSGQYYNQGMADGASGVVARTMPDVAVFSSYVADGTPINIVSIPTSGGVPTISGELISPLCNPYGATNELGIYVIDCATQKLIITDSRIVGTLVLANPGSGSEVRGSVTWEPAVANYPALLVDGSMRVSFDKTPLSEGSLGVNFNPPGTPFEGAENGDRMDTYPSQIKGLVYVSGDAETLNSCTFDGVVVVGVTMTTTNELSLTYDQTFLNDPPPGFGEASTMALSPGSWRQVVD